MTKKFGSFSVIALALVLSACSAKPAAHIPSLTVKVPQTIVAGCANPADLEGGGQVLICNYNGRLLHRVEATFSDRTFAQIGIETANLPKQERAVRLQKEIDRAMKEIRGAGGLAQSAYPEAGYFTFMLPVETELLAPLKSLHFSRELYFNPVLYDPNALVEVRAHTPRSEGLTLRNDGRSDHAGFSGLERMHAPAFVKMAEQAIGGGVKVDGSSVNLGITDTGITYNHPTFLDSTLTHSRVKYMRDFTAEGRIYFNSAAKFAASIIVDGKALEPDQVSISAEFIETPKLPNNPVADQFKTVTDTIFKVSPELREKLMAEGAKIGFGYLNENSLNGPSETVDINGNGKTDDLIPVFMLNLDTPQPTVYVSTSVGGDFRRSPPLLDFNASGSLMPMFAEKIGFDIKSVKLPVADGKSETAMMSASIVGYDPGNHGSHVAGIAAGRKTIANDPDDTLARGVAPAASILMNRVCANNSGCNATEALIDLATLGGAEVINMSLGGLSPFNDGYGVQETVINRLTSAKNVLFVISAGNSGPGRQTIGSPSTARLSLSVGASASRTMIERQYQWPGFGASTQAGVNADDDFMLFFSSRGPTASGGFKPNLVAPGTELSSVQLNSSPGSRAGLDVYWGTSMAAPSATGAYALFLDAIKKFNLAHPEKALTTDAAQLRSVLIASARPFDVNRFGPQTGEHRRGQYTWIDQGTGIIDLTAAWSMVQALRDENVPSAVTLNGKSVELDYEVVTSITGPNGIKYDGSQNTGAKVPAFGAGLFLDASTNETLRQVNISRTLPYKYGSSADAGELTRQLVTTADEFVLKTTIYGSDQAWLTAGVQDGLDCASSPTSNLTVLGRGVEIEVDENGKGTLSPSNPSALNICLNRAMIAHGLPQGDHGALIAAYRTVNGVVSSVPSFIVPVFLTVPHQTLTGSTGYLASRQIPSFGVDRNYIKVPVGTSLIRITLEVPELKRQPDGNLAAGETCSAVEAMMLEGGNTAGMFKSRAEARIMNCDALGAPAADTKRKLVVTRTNPKAGMWDLNVFGSYKYKLSKYTLRVDYVTATSSVKEIKGPLSALNGSLDFTVQEASMAVVPDSAKSDISVSGFKAQTNAKVKQDENLNLPSALGETARTYAADVKSVTITTGGAPSNDIDLTIGECVRAADGTVDPGTCTLAAMSGGSSDEESATFTPKVGKVYLAVVAGYDVKNDGSFTSTETIRVAAEKGDIVISGESPRFHVDYHFDPVAITQSRLFKDSLFTSGKYAVAGALTLRASDDTVLGSVPVEIRGQ